MIKYVGSAKRKMALIVDFKYSEIVFISYNRLIFGPTLFYFSEIFLFGIIIFVSLQK